MSFPDSYYETRFSLGGAPDPLPERFAIITAHNPKDLKWSARMNRTADHRLRRLLERKLLPHFRATGHAPDHSHAEPGWAVVADITTSLAIGRRFRQRALWWIEDDELNLIAVEGDPREMIGRFKERTARLQPR